MKKEQDLILAIDSGTQNVKAAVFDLTGKVLALSGLTHDPDSTPYPRWVEHDPEEYWEKMCSTTREVLSSLGPDIRRIGAVGLTSQRGTIIPIDKNGEVLRPAIVYLDNRITEGLGPIKGFWGLFFKVIGKEAAIEYVRSHSKFLWIKKYQPEIYNQTYKFMPVTSFLNYRLTGEICESMGSMVGMYPIDYNKLKYYPQKGIQDAFGITPSQLPELKRPQSIMGYITKDASNSTMIPEGLPVVIGGGDMQSAVVGMGVTEERSAALILGTTVCFIIPSGKFLNEDKIRFLSWPSAVPDNYILESGVGGGFLTVTWFKRELAHYEMELSKQSEKSPEDLLNEAVKDIPPGSLGLIVQPYWTPPFHRPEARGSILGLTMVHSRAHLYRAILEGFSYEIKSGYEVILSKSKTPINEIRVCGGGSKSDAILSIIADVFQIPTVRMEVEESTALGAAICAGAGTGMFSDYQEGIQKMVHKKDTFLPNTQNREVYEILYKSYQSLYPRIEGLYMETEEILHQKDEFK